MEIANKYNALNHLRAGFLNSPQSPRNEISKIFQKKLIHFGDTAVLSVYRKPKVTWRRKVNRIKPFEQKERKATSFIRSKNNVYRIIKCNTVNLKQIPTFWTFTFNPSLVGDVKILRIANEYFSTFRKELNRRMKFKAKYLAVPEFQPCGNVHYHVIFFNLPFIEADSMVFNKRPDLLYKKVFDFSMNDIWKYGFTEPILLDKVQHIAPYLTKYMSKAFEVETGNRIFGEKLYFTSKGLERPIEVYDERTIDILLKSDNIKLRTIAEYYAKGLRIINITNKENGKRLFNRTF